MMFNDHIMSTICSKAITGFKVVNHHVKNIIPMHTNAVYYPQIEIVSENRPKPNRKGRLPNIHLIHCSGAFAVI